MPAWLLPAIGAAGTLLTNVWNAKEAAKNREFQREMSNTAHQREVRDLNASGLNPLLSTRLGGSSTPSGDRAEMRDISSGVATGLAVARQRAELDLLRAQEQKTVADTQSVNQSLDERTSGQAFRVGMLRDQARLAEMSVPQRQEMFKLELSKAKAEIASLQSSAARNEQLTVLDKLAEEGAINEAEFERMMQGASPGLRWLMNAARLFNLATGEPVRRIP